MSTTLTRLKDDMKAAMRGGEKFRLGVIRMVLAAVKQREVDDREAPDEAAVQALLEKMIKQRRDAIEQFAQGGRDDLADRERDEVAVLEAYLPQALTREEIEALVNAAIVATGATGMRDMGKVMAQVKANATGRLDMAVASDIVKARLTSQG